MLLTGWMAKATQSTTTHENAILLRLCGAIWSNRGHQNALQYTNHSKVASFS
jgi:hypothetical protein